MSIALKTLRLHAIRCWRLVLIAGVFCAGLPAWAGTQKEEALSATVATAMQRSIRDSASPRLVFANATDGTVWLAEMSSRLKKRIPDDFFREKLLTAIHYEATRAGLDPQLVLGLIQVESGFKKYAISEAGARGLMQVMPFWVRSIGSKEHNLFDMYTNLRFGCTILRHYLDIENGDLYRALGRYNGSLGKPDYPNLVLAVWRNHWSFDPATANLRLVSTETAVSTPRKPGG